MPTTLVARPELRPRNGSTGLQHVLSDTSIRRPFKFVESVLLTLGVRRNLRPRVFHLTGLQSSSELPALQRPAYLIIVE